jgi:hypothetical protein
MAMIETNVCLYLHSHSRIALLEKTLSFQVLPRLQEFVKVKNREQGDYFAFSVVQVTHREDGIPELWLKLTACSESTSKVDFMEDEELDEYVAGYSQEGWKLASIKPHVGRAENH